MARNGLSKVMSGLGGTMGWREASRGYRQFLYVSGEARGLKPDGKPMKPGFQPEKVQEVLEAGGELSVPQVLRCRVRYFTDGVVLGTQGYVDEVFRRFRLRFSEKRQTGARPMKGGFPGLFTARRLRLDVITLPATG